MLNILTGDSTKTAFDLGGGARAVVGRSRIEVDDINEFSDMSGVRGLFADLLSSAFDGD